jgi:hypothetical protein
MTTKLRDDAGAHQNCCADHRGPVHDGTTANHGPVRDHHHGKRTVSAR